MSEALQIEWEQQEEVVFLDPNIRWKEETIARLVSVHSDLLSSLTKDDNRTLCLSMGAIETLVKDGSERWGDELQLIFEILEDQHKAGVLGRNARRQKERLERDRPRAIDILTVYFKEKPDGAMMQRLHTYGFQYDHDRQQWWAYATPAAKAFHDEWREDYLT